MKPNGYHSDVHEAVIIRLDQYFIVQQTVILGNVMHDASEKSISALCYMQSSSGILYVTMTTTHSINYLEHPNPDSDIDEILFTMVSIEKSGMTPIAMMVTQTDDNQYYLFRDDSGTSQSVYLQCRSGTTGTFMFRQFETSGRMTFASRTMLESGANSYIAYAQKYTSNGKLLS